MNSTPAAQKCTKSLEIADVPEDFLCPLTMEIMVSPVMTRWGHSFEREAIFEWMTRNEYCPLTRNPISMNDIIPNRVLQSRITMWREEHGMEFAGDHAEGRVLVFLVSKKDQKGVIKALKKSDHPLAHEWVDRMAKQFRSKNSKSSRRARAA